MLIVRARERGGRELASVAIRRNFRWGMNGNTAPVASSIGYVARVSFLRIFSLISTFREIRSWREMEMNPSSKYTEAEEGVGVGDDGENEGEMREGRCGK